MDNILSTSPPSFVSNCRKQGFTLIEAMVAIAVVAILSAIALPSMSDFLVRMRVDNEISEMQRLLLTARNMAINTGRNTTVCPLSNGTCTTNWAGEISVFTNSSNTADNDKYDAATEELVKVKDVIKSGDKLQFGTFAGAVYTPEGRLSFPAVASTFKYCPKDKADRSRGIDISISGRSYTSVDTDHDDKDEDRNGNEIKCI